MTDKMKEIRNINFGPFEVRERSDGSMVLDGYPILYGVKTTIAGWFTEEIKHGAFTESIQTDDVRALLNHDSNFVLGRNKAGTLTLVEDEKGVRCEIYLPNNSIGQDVYASVKRGDISQMSFAFWVEEEEWIQKKDELDHRTVKKGKLMDVSPVTFPAYEETEINARAIYEAREVHNSGQVAADEEKNETVDGDDQARVRMAHRRRKLDLLDKEI